MEFCNILFKKILLEDYQIHRVSVSITVDVPVTAVLKETNDIQCFKDIYNVTKQFQKIHF